MYGCTTEPLNRVPFDRAGRGFYFASRTRFMIKY